jgi:hypothetical protein
VPRAPDAEVNTALEAKARRRRPLVKRAPPPDRQAWPRRGLADWPSDPLLFMVESAETPVALESWDIRNFFKSTPHARPPCGLKSPCSQAVRPSRGACKGASPCDRIRQREGARRPRPCEAISSSGATVVAEATAVMPPGVCTVSWR